MLPCIRLELDAGWVLAHLERKEHSLARVRDVQVAIARHGDGPVHLHTEETDVPDPYHVGM